VDKIERDVAEAGRAVKGVVVSGEQKAGGFLSSLFGRKGAPAATSSTTTTTSSTTRVPGVESPVVAGQTVSYCVDAGVPA
jgi:hypothetical protein